MLPSTASSAPLMQTASSKTSYPTAEATYSALPWAIAVAALRSAACLLVRPDEHSAELKIWAKQHRGRAGPAARWRAGCTRCSAISSLEGVSERITAGQAARILLEQVQPLGSSGAARWPLAQQFLADLRRIDVQRRDVQK